jgi:hypothetical protein
MDGIARCLFPYNTDGVQPVSAALVAILRAEDSAVAVKRYDMFP